MGEATRGVQSVGEGVGEERGAKAAGESAWNVKIRNSERGSSNPMFSG